MEILTVITQVLGDRSLAWKMGKGIRDIVSRIHQQTSSDQPARGKVWRKKTADNEVKKEEQAPI